MNYKARDLQEEILFIDLFHFNFRKNLFDLFYIPFLKYLTAPWDIKPMFKRSQKEAQFC